MMDFTGAAATRTAAGFAAAVSQIGCSSAALEAVVHVETGGSGFDKSKRPKMLFEPHVFYRVLAADKAKKALLAKALAAGLAYPVWGTKPYPDDSYPRLALAMAIDEELALQAASWGLPQILGENFKDAGYRSAKEMVAAFVSGGEDEHLEAMAKFIVAKKLDAALKALKWATFALGYNGKLYKKNGYDTKLANAYALALKRPEELSDSVSAVPKAAALNAEIKRQTQKKAATAGASVPAVAATAAAGATAVPHHIWPIAAVAIVIAILAVGIFVAAKRKAQEFSSAGA